MKIREMSFSWRSKWTFSSADLITEILGYWRDHRAWQIHRKDSNTLFSLFIAQKSVSKYKNKQQRRSRLCLEAVQKKINHETSQVYLKKKYFSVCRCYNSDFTHSLYWMLAQAKYMKLLPILELQQKTNLFPKFFLSTDL